MTIEKVIIGDAILYRADCMDILPTLGRVDAVITDPPFGVGNFVQVTGRLRGRGLNRGCPVEWNESGPTEQFFRLIQGLSTHRIIWGANFFNCFEDRGGAIVWVKKQRMPNFSKADIASCTHFQKTEVVEIPWTNFTVARMAETDHPCERPVALYDWCIKHLPPCESFLDPYMGSASVGVACLRAGKSFIGIEREEKYFDIACRRIEEAAKQGQLFEPTPPKQEQTKFF